MNTGIFVYRKRQFNGVGCSMEQLREKEAVKSTNDQTQYQEIEIKR